MLAETLARQFTIFGQQIRLGCPNDDAAIYLTHLLSRYDPHFIAPSEFQHDADTG